jgi:hypothetical protein
MQAGGSHRGIFRELDFDEPVLLDKLHFFCRLRNRLSTPVSCFSELYETYYGSRFGIKGLVKGMVRQICARPKTILTSLGRGRGICLYSRTREISSANGPPEDKQVL